VNPFLNSLPSESVTTDFWAFTVEARDCFCPVPQQRQLQMSATGLFRALPERKPSSQKEKLL